MLTTTDVGDLFHSMRIAYGGQWKHGADAIETWRRALARWDAPDIHGAANKAIGSYVNHPPTLPQFLELLKPATRPNTYLPAPQMSRTATVANLVLMRVLMEVEGVDKMMLKNLVALKNALFEECSETPTKAWVADTYAQLLALAKNHDQEAKARETDEAREVYCRRQGLRFVPRAECGSYGRGR